MQQIYESLKELPSLQKILRQCPRLIGMFLLGFHWESPAVPNFCKLFDATPDCLSILELRHCTFSFSTLMSIGRLLPHLQAALLFFQLHHTSWHVSVFCSIDSHSKVLPFTA